MTKLSLVTTKKWRSVHFRSLAGLEKDAETFMMRQIMNIGRKTQEETEDLKRTRKTAKRTKNKKRIRNISSD